MKTSSFVFACILCGTLATRTESGDSITSIRGLQSTGDIPLDLAETEENLMDWVARVDSNYHSGALQITTSTAASITTGNAITVGQGGSADFTTVQAAVDAVPQNNNNRVTIQIAAGVYEEKVIVPESKPFLTFQGAGSSLTTITWDDTASSSGSTTNSASVAITSDYFIARDIAFKNSAPAPPPGATGMQAVALRISGDKAAFYNCNFYGAQDTLYDDEGRHYFQDCFIQGSIDFIFGDGQSLYQGCELHAIAISTGSLTAQSRSSPGEDTGFSFVNCKVTGSGMLYLGRAWGPYSRVVFSYTYIADIIVPQGWNNWGDPSRDITVFYGQYMCSGPGASEQGRVTWSRDLTAAQAEPFQSLSFIDGDTWVQS